MDFSRRSFLELGLASSLSLTSLRADVRKEETIKPLGVAILGLGGYAKKWIAPAIVQSTYTRLTGIVTGSPDKVASWQSDYEIPDGSVYSYENLEDIASNEEIDIVYIITPTGTHCDFTLRALAAGKHVICEKPMATSVEECDRMIAAAKKHDRLLQIGYRLYWDPFNVRIMSGLREKVWGDTWSALETRIAYNPQFTRIREGEDLDWRISKKYSRAGALFEVGVYAVQGAFYASQEMPLKVTAFHETRRPEVFTEVPEHWEWELEWSGGRKSQHVASFGDSGCHLKMTLPEGELHCDRAFEYHPKSLITPDGDETFTNVFQQRRQIDGQALAILNRHPNLTPGEMGRRDIYVIEKIMEAAESKTAISLNGFSY